MNTEFLFESNAANDQKTVAYIIGNAFSNLATLPDVYTVNQFFSAMLENNLPEHRLWIIGQGVPASVHEILSLCKKYRSDIYFYDAEETILLERNQTASLPQPVLTDTVLSKLSQMMKAIAHRFRFCR